MTGWNRVGRRIIAAALITGCMGLAACGGAAGNGSDKRSQTQAEDSTAYTEEGQTAEQAQESAATQNEEGQSGEALAGAASQEQGEALNAVDAEIEIKSVQTSGDNVVEIPLFVTPSGESTKSLDELNKEAEKLQKLYDDVKDDETQWVEIRSYITEGERYLQVTVTSNTFPTYGTEGDLITLAYDKNTDTAVTNQEVLKRAGLTGDELSTYTNQAFGRAGMTGKLEETEMQGFRLSDDGAVELIYMKLRVDEGTDSGAWDGFFAYDPQEQTLSKLSFGMLENGGSASAGGSEAAGGQAEAAVEYGATTADAAVTATTYGYVIEADTAARTIMVAQGYKERPTDLEEARRSALLFEYGEAQVHGTPEIQEGMVVYFTYQAEEGGLMVTDLFF
ncbi:MAG: hypothetical protein Q4C60_01400 [Eubacteriales bacterium]|nr:hypothetical protein [Eubacteriales bacterium]